MNFMNAIKNSFNKAASSYNDHCLLQKETGNALIELVRKHCSHASRILDLGCGTGVVTEQLAIKLNFETFISIDIANQLLATAASLLNPYSIEVKEADFNQPFALGKFDLIFSNMALHWSEDFILTLRYISKNLAETGLLAFSIPLYGTFDEIKNTVSIQTFMQESEVKELLASLEYEIIMIKVQTFSFNFPNFLAALQSIKKVGATFVKRRNFSFSTLKQMIQTEEKQALTYRVGFFIAHSI